MPETKQTAMMQLIEKIDAKICKSELPIEIGAFIMVKHIITSEMLEIEKQTLIDFYIECMKKGLEVDGSEWKELYLPKITDVATNYFNQTFNTK